MRKTLFALTGAALLAGGYAFSGAEAAAAEEVTLYKNPQCGCCQNYADYLEANGYEVTVEPTHALPSMSVMAGVPENLQGCHLAFIGDYVVSGHVPVNVVDRMLEERPAIKGVTLPGMPMGSPGMGGEKMEPFTIYALSEGEPTVYAVE